MSHDFLIVPTTNAEQLLSDMIDGAKLTSVYELHSITKPAKIKYWLETRNGRFMVPNSAVESLIYRNKICRAPVSGEYSITVPGLFVEVS